MLTKVSISFPSVGIVRIGGKSRFCPPTGTKKLSPKKSSGGGLLIENPTLRFMSEFLTSDINKKGAEPMEIIGSKPPNKRVSGYKETVVTFTILGEPKRSSNPNYITNNVELKALREVFPWFTSEYKKMKRSRNMR